jgi:hypothetical protein
MYAKGVGKVIKEATESLSLMIRQQLLLIILE